MTDKKAARREGSRGRLHTETKQKKKQAWRRSQCYYHTLWTFVEFRMSRYTAWKTLAYHPAVFGKFRV